MNDGRALFDEAMDALGAKKRVKLRLAYEQEWVTVSGLGQSGSVFQYAMGSNSGTHFARYDQLLAVNIRGGGGD